VANRIDPTGDDPGDNQLASVFFRWAIPKARVEAYAEYGREDHSWNLRDFWLEPDHDAALLFGLQRVWTRQDGSLTALRVERLNTRISHLTVSSLQSPWYAHFNVREGHTLRGQALGSAGGFGGGAATIAVDRYDGRGRTSIKWERINRAERLGARRLPYQDQADVWSAIGAERVRFLHHGELSVGVRGVWDLNRDFVADRFNLNVVTGYRFAPGE
jgi:hypothetical protein